MEGYIAEMRYFASNFAPKNWALCAGQLMAISTNQALFSLLGTTYGGDGRTTFALPDARGRFIVSPGQSQGTSNYALGQKSGSPTTTLTLQNLPSHTHTIVSSAVSGSVTPVGSTETSTSEPNGMRFGAGDGINPYSQTGSPDTTLTPASVSGITNNISIGTSGGSQPMPILSPYLGLNVVICQFGIFPSRN
ncbi:MAG: tail fiber protein [Bacteroidia bacterium]|nr:tail fiber protein [Bacteroidia bacterium]